MELCCLEDRYLFNIEMKKKKIGIKFNLKQSEQNTIYLLTYLQWKKEPLNESNMRFFLFPTKLSW